MKNILYIILYKGQGIKMEKAKLIVEEVKKAVIGKEDVIVKALMVILAKGHILLEDIPGVGKTTIAVAFSKAMSLDSNRMQFTVDVLPSDVVGFSMIDAETGNVKLHKGAIFCNVFLADEINRTSSKTQAALLEVMEEGSISVDGYTQAAPSPFLVIATQNPLGSAGTQLLPESQLDRFMVRMSIGYPSLKDEIDILKRKHGHNLLANVTPVVSVEDVLAMQKECEDVYIEESVYEYMVRLIQATRANKDIRQGASPRAAIALMNMTKACAYMHGRDFVYPEDVQEVFYDVIGHRILLHSDGQVDKNVTKQILKNLVKEVEIPAMVVKNV